MELLLLLFIPLALGAVFSGDGGDDADTAPSPETEPGGAGATDGDDILRGNGGDNISTGGDGDDLIFGYRGDDTLAGGPGNDLLDGGLGDDQLFGGNGDDAVAGAAGDDSLQGGNGVDLLMGGAGDDTLDGGNDDDILFGSTGADILYGGAGNDVMDGVSPVPDLTLNEGLQDIRNEFSAALSDQYGDAITEADIGRFLSDFTSDEGAHGPDALYGGTGEDLLSGDNGDTLSGGADEDFFAIRWTEGNAPVQITDYDTVAGEGIRFIVEGDSQDFAQLSLRDAADGGAAEFLLGQEVVLTLQGVSADQVGTGTITLQNSVGFGISNPVVRLP